MRTEELRPRRFIQSILTKVVDDTGDLQRQRPGLTTAAAAQCELPLDRVFVGPITLGHRVVDYGDPGGRIGVELIEQPATQQPGAGCAEIAGCSGRLLRNRFLAGRTRRLPVDRQWNRRRRAALEYRKCGCDTN